MSSSEFRTNILNWNSGYRNVCKKIDLKIIAEYARKIYQIIQRDSNPYFCTTELPSSFGCGGLMRPRSFKSALLNSGFFKSSSEPKYSSMFFFFFEFPLAACGRSSPKYSSTFFLLFYFTLNI